MRSPDDGVQLRLLAAPELDPEWVLDEPTRSAGRQGIAQARAALREAHPPQPGAHRYSRAS